MLGGNLFGYELGKDEFPLIEFKRGWEDTRSTELEFSCLGVFEINLEWWLGVSWISFNLPIICLKIFVKLKFIILNISNIDFVLNT